MARDKIAGTIGTPSPKVEGQRRQQLSPQEVLEKIDRFRKGMYAVTEAVFDNARQQILYRAKHPTLIGDEITVGVDLASALFTIASIIPVHVIPVLNGEITVTRKGVATDEPAPIDAPPHDLLAEISALLRKLDANLLGAHIAKEVQGMAARIDVRLSVEKPS